MRLSLPTGKNVLRRWGLVGLFLLAFLPRALYPVSRPLQWYMRSGAFWDAVLQGDWAGTLLSEHPGVTVMWLSGGALWGWHALQSALGLPSPPPLETEGYAFVDRVAVGVIPLALIVAAGVVWGWHLLHRLFGDRVAWTAAILWAVDPFFLANSRVLHLDATLSTLMLLSALWMLIYLKERRLKPLIVSALLGGLAVLTKVTALYLIPFLGLCLLVDWISAHRTDDTPDKLLQSSVVHFALWIAIVAGICTALWPSLWVQPAASFDRVIRQGILLHTGGPRDQPLFYRGTLAVQDPGPRFYLDVLLYRSTFLTLPLGLVGLLTMGIRRRLRDEHVEQRAAWLLLAFAGFYFVQMSLGGWKDSRYMLPVFLVLDIFAARGLAWLTARLPGVRSWDAALLAALIGIQGVTILARHPYYGTHYNALLGGARAAADVFALAEFGEGLDQAGRYIDKRLEPQAGRVATQFLANEMVTQHVRAPVYDVAQVGDDAEYLVFGVQYTMRGATYPRWGELWEETYKFREPAHVAAFGDLPYAWVHRPGAPPAVPQPLEARIGGTIRLIGYRLTPSQAAPGDTLLLTLYWETDESVGQAYKVFTHLIGPRGQITAQQDNQPRRGTFPTDIWDPGMMIEDPYELTIPTDAAMGTYGIQVGMYDPITLERLPISEITTAG